MYRYSIAHENHISTCPWRIFQNFTKALPVAHTALIFHIFKSFSGITRLVVSIPGLKKRGPAPFQSDITTGNAEVHIFVLIQVCFLMSVYFYIDMTTVHFDKF